MHWGWELKIDGATCPSGIMAQDLYVYPSQNPHRGMAEIYGVRSMTPADFGVSLQIGAYIFKYVHVSYIYIYMYIYIYTYVCVSPGTHLGNTKYVWDGHG